MLFIAYLISNVIFITICGTVKDTHWTEFVPIQEAETRNNSPHSPAHDSHKTLNRKSRAIKPFREDYLASEIPLGHTGRSDFIPLLDHRDQIEENVNRGVIAGIVLRKSEDHHKASQSMFNYAYEQRRKAQEIQRQMDEIKQAGHIDRRAEDRDRYRLSRARIRDRTNKHEENQKKNLDRFKRESKYYREKLQKKRRLEIIPDLNLPPPNHD